MLSTEHMGGPIPGDRSYLPTYLHAFTTNPSDLFDQYAPLDQISDGR